MRAGVLAATFRVLRLEGWRAARDRAADRRHDAAWRRAFVAALPVGANGVGVLNLLSTPPAVRLGGVQIQLQSRLSAEAELRGAALLFRSGSAWRLLRRGGPSHGEPVGAASDSGGQRYDDELVRAVRIASGRVGAGAVHVENVAGFPLGGLLAIVRGGLTLVLGSHDFALFCERPHLIEASSGRFCGYSRDPVRCEACLGHDRPRRPGYQDQWRALARELLAAAEAVVYPSRFARDTHLALFTGLDEARHVVIAPAALLPEADALPAHHPGPLRRVAFLGPVKAHKGGAMLPEVVRLLAADRGPGLQFRVYGGGDAGLLDALHGLPRVRVRGSYRAGALPALLVNDRIDLALLLSIWPETHALVLDECAAASVPVIAFDLGAQGERIRFLGIGETVPPALGAQGIAEAVARRAQARQAPEVPPGLRARLGTPADAARAHLNLFHALGLL